jgi:hypothetical protein
MEYHLISSSAVRLTYYEIFTLGAKYVASGKSCNKEKLLITWNVNEANEESYNMFKGISSQQPLLPSVDWKRQL